ncbi:Bug family tripartite tricarboxylate transporter substrate binding protein [Achromobacter sp.]|uniref:Bug family tripartite tricarboxylate transporter substrate binding protein n=1 Tax=Achromobacter sp. TaxID=134375 RepID=UPI003C75FD4F
MSMKKVFAAAALAFVSTTAFAQNYPTQPVKLIVGFSAGGANDVIARIIAQGIQTRSGQSVVVYNKPGAGSTLGTDELAKASPNGYTLLLGSTGGQAIAPFIYKTLPYDPVNDVQPVTLIAKAAIALIVRNEFPAKSVKELLAYAKANPGKLNYASPGNGTGSHLTAELFKKMTDTDIVHVPYRGDMPAMSDVMAGLADMTFASLPSAIAGLKSGKVRILAVTSAQRMKSMPDVPTIAESGVAGFDVSTWYGMFTTGGTPAAVVDSIAHEIALVAQDPAAKSAIEKQGVEVAVSKPTEFREFMNTEMKRWGSLARSLDIEANN